MSFGHPFQKLCCFCQGNQSQRQVLLAATGPRICLFDVSTGDLLSTWPESERGEVDDGARGEDSERPSKRRKLGETHEDSDESIEIVAERTKGTRRKQKILSNKQPNVSHLVATADGSHVIAVTTEDKCIRVLSVSVGRRLHTQSQRCMPKRLCAITLTPDGETIVAGDKFGDIYSLPLVPTLNWTTAQSTNRATEYKPAANELTVHTKGNLEALRQQQLQRQTKPRKESPDFEHKLLLGHVSLLTDILVAETIVENKSRQYILSADRDEHIRVSRGIPQAHVIENYCHGHKDFITKLCIPPWAPHYLIAGSGEPALKMYDWREGSLVQEIPFQRLVAEALVAANIELAAERSFENLAVAGIWTTSPPTCIARNNTSTPIILLAVEGFPVLLSFRWLPTNNLQYHQSILLTGNILDVANVPADAEVEEGALILVSTDTVHLPTSTNTFADSPSDTYFQAFRLGFSPSGETVWCQHPLAEQINGTIQRDPMVIGQFEADDQNPTTDSMSASAQQQKQQTNRRYSSLGEFLYGLENLRKKRGPEAVDVGNGDEEEGGDR